MRRLFILFLLFCGHAATYGARSQPPVTHLDSVLWRLDTCPPNDLRMALLTHASRLHMETNPIVAIKYAQEGLLLARQQQKQLPEAKALIMTGWSFAFAGNFPLAVQSLLQGMHLAETLDYQMGIADASNALGYIYSEQGNNQLALRYYFRAMTIATEEQNHGLLAVLPGNIGLVYRQANQLDSALHYAWRGYQLGLSQQTPSSLAGDLNLIGSIYLRQGKTRLARRAYYDILQRAKTEVLPIPACKAHLGLAELQQTANQLDSALYNAHQALRISQDMHYLTGILEASQHLDKAYLATHDTVRAHRYLALASAVHDSLFGLNRTRQVQTMSLGEELRKQDQAYQQAQVDATHRQFIFIAALAALAPVLLLFWRNNRLKQRTNQLLSKRNKHIAHQRDALRTTIHELKETQTQLVAAEKWAFVGELSAGIAHELQNPLHFMKKFADVSTQLLNNVQSPQDTPRRDAQLEQEIVAGLRQNLHEISQHGLRASSIIQDMLVHAHSGRGEQVPTDVNQLAEDCLRLVYQDVQSTTSVPITLEMRLHPQPPLVAVVPSDLSRVLLNIYTNACYAVQQRWQQQVPDYQPILTVSTHATAHQFEIRVRDNGTGIPAASQERIFHPFFTTKPLGDGSGLGLSLSYDIITKGHGGTLRVESQEGEFTEFIITLPIG